VPDAGARSRGRRVQSQLRRVEAAGVLAGVVAGRVGEADQRVPAGTSGDRGGDAVGQLLQRQQRDPGAQVLRPADVRVEARDPDVEAPGQLGDGDGVEAHLVGQVGSGTGHPFRRQSHAHHAAPSMMMAATLHP
jgi:hypothetical protein